LYFFFIILKVCVFLLFSGPDVRQFPAEPNPQPVATAQDSVDVHASMETIRSKYDTLIPILGGWFITADSFDLPAYAAYMERLNPGKYPKPKDSDVLHFVNGWGWDMKAKKWGVVDSLGRVMVPFICDAVREYEKGKGVFSIYAGSRPLNTGLPRYNYSGYYFFFDRNGLSDKPGKLFKVTTIFVGDFHKPEWVIQNGNGFYLPLPYHQRGKNSRGALSNEYPGGQ
jgi:hypothetical protein